MPAAKAPIKIVEAEEADIERIGRLAARIWNEYYPDIISTAQISYMLDLMYSPLAIKKQMAERQNFYLVISDGQDIGFFSLSDQKRVYILHKLYIDTPSHHRGLGSRVMKEITALTAGAGIKLTVNRQNYKAINFYFKNGFVIDQVADFDIGQGFIMNDFIMIRPPQYAGEH